jgi:glutaredoxin
MKLYVCWGTFPVPWPRRGADWRPSAHPCKRAHDALTQAGHSPDVVKVHGFAQLPDITKGRKKVKRLTGQSFVPVLVLDDGQLVENSDNIVEWARGNPAAAADPGDTRPGA